MIKNKKIRKLLKLDKRRKRTTFLRIFSKAAAVALALTGLFAYFAFHFTEMYIAETADKEIGRTHSNLMQTMTQFSHNGNTHSAEATLPPHTYFMVGDPLNYVDSYNTYDKDNNSAAISVLLDKDGNEIATSRRRFMAMIVFEKVDKELKKKYPENGWYSCDADNYDIPELKEFYEEYIHINKFYMIDDTKINENKYIDFNLKSAYVNKAEHLFIPHEVTAEYKKDTYHTNAPTETEVYKTEDYVINADIEGYELVQLHKKNVDETEYPFVVLPTFQGTEPNLFDEFWGAVKNDVTLHTTDVYSGSFDYDNFPGLENKCEGTVYYIHSNFNYNGEDCTLCTVFAVGLWDDFNKDRFAIMVGCVAAFLLILAFLYSWRKNVMNKADYAFEDFQKDLTNNLAHDLKTPLAAIGGYAENLMETATDEKQQKYLRSILDNVAYTDSMISKTLELNSGDMQKVTKSKFDMREIADSAIAKYKVQLDERGIKTSIDGNMEVNTDRDMMTAAIENLVSNAVKYTRNDGNINITMNKREFKISNDVPEKVDTRDLTKPFIRGDKNRSGRSGSGLGLSIADKSLTACGFILELECTDKEFTAVVRC